MNKYLIKLGEISLKGLNRASFQTRLSHNIKDKILPDKCKIRSQKGRLFLEAEESVDTKKIEKALSTTFGIEGWAKCLTSDVKTIDTIIDLVFKAIDKNDYKEGSTFKVETRREDKSFPLRSYDVSCTIGEKILTTFKGTKVKLKNPDNIIYVEIRKEISVYTSSNKGVSGLPVGSSGKGISLLSGGIDSPVSSYLMAKRGMKLELLYFHAYPYTSDEAKEKVVTLAKTIAPYLNGTVLHIVSFTELELKILKNGYENQKTLMLRAAMVKASECLAKLRRADALITGEALSQVASQTIKALDFTSSMTDYLILRPLVGFCKEEIISISKQINTFETSILPYQDCCVLFSPKHPKTRPDREKMIKAYQDLNLDEEIKKAVDERETIYIKANEL